MVGLTQVIVGDIVYKFHPFLLAQEMCDMVAKEAEEGAKNRNQGEGEGEEEEEKFINQEKV